MEKFCRPWPCWSKILLPHSYLYCLTHFTLCSCDLLHLFLSQPFLSVNLTKLCTAWLVYQSCILRNLLFSFNHLFTSTYSRGIQSKWSACFKTCCFTFFSLPCFTFATWKWSNSWRLWPFKKMKLRKKLAKMLPESVTYAYSYTILM